MKYRFQNLLGVSYRDGDAVFASDSFVLLSVVENRVASTDLAASSSFALPFDSSSNVTRLATSPSGNFFLSADNKGRALYANLRPCAVLHCVSFKGTPEAIRFSPDDKLIAVTIGKVVQIWRSLRMFPSAVLPPTQISPNRPGLAFLLPPQAGEEEFRRPSSFSSSRRRSHASEASTLKRPTLRRPRARGGSYPSRNNSTISAEPARA